MFSARTSSAKPGDEFLANFRQQFPEVSNAAGSPTAVTPPDSSQTAGPGDTPMTGGEQGSQETNHSNHPLGHEAFKDLDPTPRANHDQWRFTPSLLDPNSFAFTSFANQPPGYYAPTPGAGTTTIFHPQAGDLHTPTIGLTSPGVMGLPTTDQRAHHNAHNPHNHPTNMMDMSNFQQSSLSPHQFQFNPNPYLHAVDAEPPTHIQPGSGSGFAPTAFRQQETGYEGIEHAHSPVDRMDSMGSVGHQGFDGATAQFTPMVGPLPSSAEKFRFRATLNAPTAMVKHADEIPITYLNKGQAYSLTLVDSHTTMPVAPGTQYRTFVRVSFEDQGQRKKPGMCWSLWKEGRGTNEAHQRGGKLQAVEFVEPGQQIEGDEKRPRVEIESTSFDGFSVLWTPGIMTVGQNPECHIAVRFNFLSTDFSHSKGVKGIPVRLCAKTNLVSPSSSPSADPTGEICYCKVKLFRDHGAERKLSNDVAHIKKTIDKIKNQIAQVESGMKDYGKRKRGSTKASENQRPGKVPKHKRTWSVSSASSAGGGASGGRVPADDDLHIKLQSLQDMFTSTRAISMLYLRGDDQDDPDAYPVVLPGESLELGTVERTGSAWQARSSRSSIVGSSMLSPSPSSLSLHSQLSVVGQPWGEASRQGSADQPVKVDRVDDDGSLCGWIEALGVDSSYVPPPERTTKPVACFYVAPEPQVGADRRPYHKAIYLMQRSTQEFTKRLAVKWQVDPNRVLRTIRVMPRGLEVEVDDDMMQELPEGQDMTIDIRELPAVQPKQAWDSNMMSDLEPSSSISNAATPLGYELRLSF